MSEKIVKSIFLEAIQKHSPDQWDVYLEENCQDAETRRRVEVLLNAHQKADSILDQPSETTDQPAIGARPGMVIGRYKLLEQIGEGGFGVVFMADQLEPVQRRVALKIIKPGMDTKEVIARFEAERQALALMDHPNIARVLDAGATDSGRPYFVMELVRGITISKYCDQNSLTPRRRLELFVTVCQAIQHAHQKGIIHRDIKPSNVLITLHDGEPVVKVIDFGVAKAINQRLTERTLFTRFAQLVGTPLYMSPEQAELSGLDVDTRTDIYSLGVLLYELLTGTTPFDRQRLIEAGYDEMRRIIREEDPPRPSYRISGLGETLTSVSVHRNTQPRQLCTLVRGELDWIVMKSLSKERGRRYETASGFAEDVLRYLGDETVFACPPSVLYRWRKLVRRHKVTFAATTLVGVSLLVGILVASWQAVRATRAEALAATDKRVAENERDRAVAAEERERQATSGLRQHVYRLSTTLAFQSLDEGNERQFVSRLKPLFSVSAAKELHGLESRYLWARYQELQRVRRIPVHETVTAIRYSADGQRIVVCGAQGAAIVYNTTTRISKSLPNELGRYLSSSPRGTYLAVRTDWDGSDFDDQPAPIQIIEIPSFKNIGGRDSESMRNASIVRFSSDERLFATAHRDGSIEIQNLLSGEGLCSIPSQPGARRVAQLRFSPDDSLLACTCSDGTAEIRQVKDGKLVLTIPADSSDYGTGSLAFSFDGRFLATVVGSSGDSDMSLVSLWNVRTGQKLDSVHDMNRSFVLAFSPDGNNLLVGGHFGAKLWRVTDDGLCESDYETDVAIWTASFSPDGNLLALGCQDFMVRIWDANSFKLLAGLPHSSPVSNLTFRPDGRQLATGGQNKVARLWDARFWSTKGLSRGIPSYDPPLAIGPDGRIATCDDADGYRIKLWNPKSGNERILAKLDLPTGALAFSPNGEVLAWGDAEGVVTVCTVATGEMRRRLTCRNEVVCIAFSPDGKYLISGGDARELIVWDRAEYTPRRLEGPPSRITCVAFSASGLLAAGGGSWDVHKAVGETRIWDLSGNTPSHTRIVHPRTVRGISFSPDNKQIAVTHDFSTGEIMTFDVANGTRVQSFLGHSSKTMCVMFSDDGRRLITGSDDRTIRFWDVESGEAIGTTRTDERIRKMALLPGGNGFVTASWEGWVRVWKATPESEMPNSPAF